MASPNIQPVVLPTTTATTTSTTTNSQVIPNQTQNHFQNQNQTLPPQQTLHPSSNYFTNNNNNGVSFNPKKRSLDSGYLIENSPYFKMRAILRDLRLHVVQALRRQEFLNCDPGVEIQKKMKLLMDTCRQLTVSMANCNSGAGAPDLVSEKLGVQNNQVMPDSQRIPGTYIVGGSAFGWNFITFHGTKPEYYGRTKELFRAGK